MKNKRAISPLIAIILLIMMAVAAAAVTFYWLNKMQGQMRGGAEQYEEKSFERMASTVEWIDAHYNNTESNLSITIQNVGTTTIPLSVGKTDPTLTWIVKDKNQDTICTNKLNGTYQSNDKAVVCWSGCSGNLVPNEIKTLIFGDFINSTCNLSSTSHVNDTTFYVSLYFAGKGTASGTFEK